MLNVISKSIEASSRVAIVEVSHMKENIRLNWWINVEGSKSHRFTTKVKPASN